MQSIRKLLQPESARMLVQGWKEQGKKVVFTNGCFDILHAGHVHYLEKARAEGNALVIGINSDASVRRLKGKKRPITTALDRSRILAALETVDAIVIFEEDTPEQLIDYLAPDILVKGADWPVDKIAGASGVLSRGGEVKTIELLEGRSSSSIIQRIKDAYCEENDEPEPCTGEPSSE